MAENYVVWFDKLRMTDVETVGGKNASLGEMISQLASSGVRVPGGFATTAQAYRDFLAHNGLADRINAMLAKLDVDDVVELARVGKEIRQLIVDTPFPAQLEAEIRTAYDQMVADSGAAPVQALVRWDPAGLAERDLAERRQLGLPPAGVLAEVRGTACVRPGRRLRSD